MPGSPGDPRAILRPGCPAADMDRRVVRAVAVRARRRARGRARRADGARLGVGDARDRALRLRCLDARSGPTCAPAPTSSATRRSPVRGLELVDPEPGVSVERRGRRPRAHGRRALRRARPRRAPDRHAERPAALLRVGADRHPRARGLGRDDRLGAGDRRAWSTPGSTRPIPTSPQPLDEPRRVGRRARDQRARRRRQRPHRRRARLGLRRRRRAAPGRQRPRHPRLGHDRRARQRRAPAWPASSWTHGSWPLRVLGDDGSGYVSDVVTAYAYAARNGARVVNASLGGPSFSRAEHDAIAAAPSTLFVVAAGNDGADNDADAEYPCDYDLANVVCVAASDRDDALAVLLELRRRQRRPRRARRRHRQHVAGRAATRCSTAPRWRRPTSPAPPRCCSRTTAALTRRGPARRAAEQRAPGARAGRPRRHRRAPGRRRRALGAARARGAAAAGARSAPAPRSRRPARRRRPPIAPRPACRCASIAARCAPSAPAACASRSARRRPAARASTSASTRAAPAACTCPRARSGARRAPHRRGPACDHRRVSARVARALRSTKRLRVVARAVAVDAPGTIAAPSARRPCGAERRRPSDPAVVTRPLCADLPALRARNRSRRCRCP